MINIKLFPKQSKAWKYLTDNKTNIVAFGGAASGGKSWLGCLWITYVCLTYPGVRCLIGRTVLTQLRQTTLNTLFDLFKTLNLNSDEHFNYNGQSNVITFFNGSEILLKDLEDKPSDVNKAGLGSLEVSAVFVDEASQISALTYSILKSRIRYKLNEYNLIPKVLLTCNPSNNWIKREIYTPYVQERLEDNIVFIPSLVSDNPHVPESYIQMLKELPPQQRRRLYEGDWDYMEESDNLFKFEEISSCIFKMEPKPTEKKIMTIDVARYGDDRSVVMIWVGLVLIDCKIYRKYNTTELFEEVKDLMRIHGIHPQNIVVDADGIGGGISDLLRAQNFVNNSSPYHNQNFTNLKSQCYTRLSEYFKEGKVSINILEPSVVDDLTQELLSVKLKNLDKDNKIGVQSKEEMKKQLGKSPDLSDAMMMRMYFEVKQHKTTGKYSITFI